MLIAKDGSFLAEVSKHGFAEDDQERIFIWNACRARIKHPSDVDFRHDVHIGTNSLLTP